MVRIATLKTVENFKKLLHDLNVQMPCDETILPRAESPLAKPVTTTAINGKQIGNRICIHPMEGWDGTRTGGITDDVLRRWQRFGQSGAKLIFGGEAMAVRPDGRANPNQLIISEENKSGLAKLRETLVTAHRELYGTTDDLVIGFQLTHSGRFCRPNSKQLEPRVAYRHPILDKKFGITSDTQVFTDSEIKKLIEDYIRAAKIAADAGADFVDIKHCHGYLLHEFLSAYKRPGEYGGSFENRTRILREIIAGIRANGNKIDIAVRLSAFDFPPFKPSTLNPQPSTKLGPGIPEQFPTPYPYAFGCNQNNPLEIDLTEPIKFVKLCADLGVKIINLSAGSPYYNPHIQRPAAYPPSDGYQPPNDPLIDVARQINVVREIKSHGVPPSGGPVLIGTGYSYLQEFLPNVAQAAVREGWTDMVGLGRMVLSYPNIFTDALDAKALTAKLICRTFSDCTTAPRNGLPSGCYPLDKHYAGKPEAQNLKQLKKSA